MCQMHSGNSAQYCVCVCHLRWGKTIWGAGVCAAGPRQTYFRLMTVHNTPPPAPPVELFANLSDLFPEPQGKGWLGNGGRPMGCGRL